MLALKAHGLIEISGVLLASWPPGLAADHQSPWINPSRDRFIGSLQAECLNVVLLSFSCVRQCLRQATGLSTTSRRYRSVFRSQGLIVVLRLAVA